MRLSNRILLATQNHDKYFEFRSLFLTYPDIELLPAGEIIRNLDGLGYAEKFDSYLENSTAKARLVNNASHYPSLADDSGLEVDALGGKPGVRSHRYAIAKGNQSQDQANVQKLLEELKGQTNRSAKFVCCLALVIEGILIHSTGVLEGTIADAPRGDHGFGYDPVFIPKGSHKTLAEITEAEKNIISHRAKAVHDLMAQVKGHGIVFAKP